jgi:hypothetical protein
VDGAVWPEQGEQSIRRSQENRPAGVVDQVVVSEAEWDEVVDVGGSELFPPHDVVDLAPLERRGAPGDRTGAMDCSQRPALFTVGDPDRASGVEWHPAVGRSDDGVEHRLTTHPAHRVDIDRGAVVEFAHRVVVVPVVQGGFIDQHDDLGDTGCAAV